MKFFVIEKKRFLIIQLRNSTMKYMLKRSNDRMILMLASLYVHTYIIRYCTQSI